MTSLLWIITLVLCFQVYTFSKRLKKAEDQIKALKRDLAVTDSQEVKEAEDFNMHKDLLNKEMMAEQQTEDAQMSVQVTLPIKEERMDEGLEVTTRRLDLPPPKEKKELQWTKNLFSVESIITKLGIVLLLIGVGYIFKLAYDSGFITRELILLGGALFGFVLIGLSYSVRKKQRLILGQVLAGGGVATLYISTYAAYQSYGIIPGMLAFIFMCVVTFIAFFISITENSLAMSIIGILGGLLTPFILELEQLGIEGTGLYIAVLAAGAMVIFIIKGWRTLQLSSIVGTYCVTTYFISYPEMTESVSWKLVGLFIVVLLVYTVTEYGLIVQKNNQLKYPVISYVLISSLPVITLMQAVAVIDLSDQQWALALTVVAFIYIALTTLLYKKLGDTYVSNITLSLIALFAFLSVLMFFGGAIEAIGILVLGIIYIALNRRWKGFYVGLIGRILIGIGYVMAFYTLINELLDSAPTFETWIVRLAVILVLGIAAFISSKVYRKVIMSLNLFGFMFIAYIGQIYWWFDKSEDVAYVFIAFIVYCSFLYVLFRFMDLIPRLGIVIVAGIPLFLKLLLFLVALYERRTLYETILSVVYVIFVYLLAMILYKDEKHYSKYMMKIIVYTIAILILYVDVTAGSDIMALSVTLVGVGFLLYTSFEPDREVMLMKVYGYIMGWSWLAIFFLYTMSVVGRSFIWYGFILDCLSLALVWLVLSKLKVKEAILKLTLLTLIFALSIFMNFSELSFGNGIITILYAVYSIGVLIISVIKANRQLVTYGLVLIILVALKFVIIDLATVKMLWKIIISMGFGTALLVLSYFLQPLLNQTSPSEDE